MILAKRFKSFSEIHRPDEVRDRETGIKEESLVGCHGVAIGNLTLETHPEGGAVGDQCDHVDTGRKTRQTGLEGEVSSTTTCFSLCVGNMYTYRV